jgi:hypothetical protein
MKYLFLLFTVLTGFRAKAQDKNVTYFKLECSGVRYSHKDTVTQKRVTDRTINKKVTIYLEKQNQSHIIFKEAGKITRYNTKGATFYPEEAASYSYTIDDHFFLEMFVMYDANNKVLLGGKKGDTSFDYIVTRTDFAYREAE